MASRYIPGSFFQSGSYGQLSGESNIPQDQGFDFFYLMEGAANVTAYADFGIAPSLDGWASSVTGSIDATQTTPANSPTSDSDGPVEFDGTQYFDVPFMSPATNMTICFGINTTTFGNRVPIATKSANSSLGGFIVRSETSTSVRLLTQGGTVQDFTTDDYSGVKTFFSISLSGTAADIYQDGLLKDSITLSTAALESVLNLTVGARFGTHQFIGDGHAFGLRSSASDAAESLALYNYVVANS